MSLFHISFHREIDQIKKLNSFDDCPFLLEFQKKGIYALFQLHKCKIKRWQFKTITLI